MKFVPTKLVPVKRTPKDMYCLHIHSCHGDADHYTDQTFKTKDVKQIESVVRLLMLGLQYETHEEETLRAELEKLGAELRIDWPIDLYADLVERDVRYQDYFATPETVTLTWFNDDGVEYYMSFDFDGERVHQLTRYNVKNYAL